MSLRTMVPKNSLYKNIKKGGGRSRTQGTPFFLLLRY